MDESIGSAVNPPLNHQFVGPHARHVRSFAIRRGHVTKRQRQAYEELFPLIAVPYGTEPIEPRTLYGRSAPLVLEIGFGMGETTVAIAQQHPEIDFLGIEVYVAGIGALTWRVHEAKLTNVRIVHHDAVEVLRDMIAPASVQGIHVFFPDPWPKARHHKRRLIAQPFARILVDRLRPGGYLHCSTDWEPYAVQMLEVFSQEPRLRNLHSGYAHLPRNPCCERPTTKFHARGSRLGLKVWDLVFERRPCPR
jgi:tRNA (guanine-N7-)-methyltransferase